MTESEPGERSPVAARPPHILLALLLGCTMPAVGAATEADDLCDPTDDPCRVTSTVEATPGAVIDVGQRELQLLGGRILVQGGDLTLRGRRVVAGTGTLLRTSGKTRADAAGELAIEADEVLLTGEIDVRGSPAGELTVTALSTLTLSGIVRGRSEAADEAAATVSLEGDVVLLTGEIDLDGGRDDTGGDLTIAGRNVTVSGILAVEGGDGGTVEIGASEALLITNAARISTRATTAAGDGGDISVLGDEAVEIRGTIVANGRDGGDDGGGDGGQVTISGDLSTVVGAEAEVDALGGSPDGLAGDIEISSLFGSVTIDGEIDAGAEDREGVGGAIDVSADTAILIGGTLKARGALGGSGDIAVEGEQNVTLTSTSVLDASSSRDGGAGTVAVEAVGDTEVYGRILAVTSSDEAGGGAVSIEGCRVTVAGTAEIRTSGRQALNQIKSLGPIVIRGTMLADVAAGQNQLRFPDDIPPDTIGASIEPQPTLFADFEIMPCVAVPPTATPTTTAVPTPTPSRSPCAGDCNQDGIVGIAELIRAVNISLGSQALESCPAADTNGDGRVAINELIQAVNAALDGCGA